MNSIAKLGTASLLAALLALPAAAQDRPRSGFPGLRGAALRTLEAADVNGDKSVARAEFDALAEEMFAWRDRNGDGALDAADRSPVAQRLAAARAEDAPARGPRRGRMSRIDADEDGRISRSEFLTAENEVFTRLDTDANGVISPDELDAQLEARRNRGRWWRD